MCHFYRFTIPALFCLIVYSCSVVPGELKTAEQLIETHPDSALRILQGISPEKSMSDESRALYTLLLTRAHDRNGYPLKPDSLLDFSIAYYRAHSDNQRLANSYLYKGRTLKYVFRYEEAIKLYLEALEVAAGTKDNILLGRINSDLGDIYITQREYALARNRYQISLDHFKKAGKSKSVYYAYIDIGRTYFHEGQRRKGQHFFRAVFTSATDSIVKGAALQELGIGYFKSKQYDSALVCFRRVIHYPYVRNNMALRYFYLSEVFYKLDEIDSANVYAKQSFAYETDVWIKHECYRILTNTEYKMGNMKQMSEYMNIYVALSDSLRKIETQTRGSVMETMHYANVSEARTKTRAWYLSGFFVVLLATSYLFYHRKQRRSAAEKKRLLDEKTRLEEEKVRLETEKALTEENHASQKSDIRMNILEKYRKTLDTKIKAAKGRHAEELQKASFSQKEALCRRVYSELLHTDNPALFFGEMDTLLNGLPSRLTERYPSVSQKEAMWCCLHLLDIPNLDIYTLLGYQVESLKKMKQRLAPKLGLTSASEINGFLLALLAE